MKRRMIPLFLLLCSSSMLTGCSVINQVKDLMSQLGGLDFSYSEDDREKGNQELFETAIDLINQKNYFMTYSSTISGIAINVNYEIDNNIAKVGENYYDYSDCDSHPDYAWEYIYDSEHQNYKKQQQDLTHESPSSKLITREHLRLNEYVFNEETQVYEMNQAALTQHNLISCSITVNGTATNLIVYIDITEQQQASQISCTARMHDFGNAHVTLPTNFVEE